EAPINYVSFRPSNTKISEMILTRKYPEKEHLRDIQANLKGSKLLGFNKKVRDTITILQHPASSNWQEVDVNNTTAYESYRFYSADGGRTHIAEMEFLGRPMQGLKMSRPTPLPIFSPKDTLQIESANLVKFNGEPLRVDNYPNVSFDGDVETVSSNFRIGMNFEIPVAITHLRFIPRTADNGINPGDKYRLYYHDGMDWRLHGTKTAKYNYILYENVPSATIYWLKNITKGKEELPFFYENDKQTFI